MNVFGKAFLMTVVLMILFLVASNIFLSDV